MTAGLVEVVLAEAAVWAATTGAMAITEGVAATCEAIAATWAQILGAASITAGVAATRATVARPARMRREQRQ